jgi:hypothetical protein
VTQPLSTFKNKLQAKITQLENAITTLWTLWCYNLPYVK